MVSPLTPWDGLPLQFPMNSYVQAPHEALHGLAVAYGTDVISQLWVLPWFCPSILVFVLSQICHMCVSPEDFTTCLESWCRICYDWLLFHSGVNSNVVYAKKLSFSSPTYSLACYSIFFKFNTYQHPNLFSYIFIYCLRLLSPPPEYKLLNSKTFSFSVYCSKPNGWHDYAWHIARAE